MQQTNIKQEFGYLGPHDRIPEVGDDKHMLFQQVSGVSFWMTPQERVYTKFSQYDKMQLKYNTKAELLESSGMDMSVDNGEEGRQAAGYCL